MNLVTNRALHALLPALLALSLSALVPAQGQERLGQEPAAQEPAAQEPAAQAPAIQVLPIPALRTRDLPAQDLPAQDQTAQKPSCDVCRETDLTQVGDPGPAIQHEPAKTFFPDGRGKVVQLPVTVQLPLANQPVDVSVRPGAGLWLQNVGPTSNVYLNAKQKALSLNFKVDF